MTSPRHVVLLAAAGAPLRRIGGRWFRVDSPAPSWPVALDEQATWQLLAEGLLCWHGEWQLQLTNDGRGETEDLLSVLAVSSDGRPSRLEILQRLAAAGEGVRREREADDDELLMLIELLTGTVVEWVAPSRGRRGERSAHICYGWELKPLQDLGLVVVAGGRALLTGAGKWAAADRDASCHANASGGGEAVG